MKEFKYYSVEITVDEMDQRIEIMGNRLYQKFSEYGFDMTEFGGEDSREWGVNRAEVAYIVNTEWAMKKDERFLENLCEKLDKIITEYHKKGIKLQY